MNENIIIKMHNEIIKEIGGKKIKSLTTACNADGNFANPEVFKDTFENAILLKRSEALVFCTYNLNTRETIWETPTDNIESYFYYKDTKKRHLICLEEKEGMFWAINIELA